MLGPAPMMIASPDGGILEDWMKLGKFGMEWDGGDILATLTERRNSLPSYM